MTARFDIVTSRKDNTGKVRYTKIGAMFPAKQGEGFAIKLDALPLPNEKGEVWLSAFVPRENDSQDRVPDRATQSRPTSQSRSAEIEDEIPFAPEVR